METNSTNTMAERLRQVADLLDAHPDLPTPYVTAYPTGTTSVSWYLHINDRGNDTQQKADAQAIIRSIGGKWDKGLAGDDARFHRTLEGLNLEVVVARDAVCTRIVKGTETVTIPAVAAQSERTEVREVVEWDCGSLLGPAPDPGLTDGAEDYRMAVAR